MGRALLYHSLEMLMNKESTFLARPQSQKRKKATKKTVKVKT